MTITDLHVQFRKTVNDGNYGNESAEVSYTAALAEGEDAAAATAELQQRAREEVLAQLKRSSNDTVLSALETREERRARRQREEAEYAEQRRKRIEQDERWQAESRARYAQAAAEQAADDDEAPDDDSDEGESEDDDGPQVDLEEARF